MEQVSVQDVRAAAELLAGVPGTPDGVVPAAAAGGRRAGAPQVREPAAHRVVQDPRAPTSGSPGCPTRRRRAGVVAASAGNHAQGVALAASLVGSTREGLHAGRRVHRQADRDPRLRRRRRTGRANRWTTRWTRPTPTPPGPAPCWCIPFDHPDVLRGQGTVGLEILEQVPEVATVVVAAGGGGLISGVGRGAPGAAAGGADRRGAGRAGRRLARVAARPAGRSGCGRCPPWPTASPSASRPR